jgi:amino acid adenylation domain-containing protein
VRGGPRHLAYVIFTSGSTGEPKGAMIEQRGMVNHLFAKVRDLSLSSSDVVLQTAPQSFDIAVWQFLSARVVGGSTRVVPDEIAHDPAALVRELVAARATVVEVVPSQLRALLDSPAAAQLPGSLRWMIATGEALPPGTCREWSTRFPDVPLVNAYGPTECSDDVTHAVFRAPEDHASTPIGRPIANTELYVLDTDGQLAPRGVPGELHVGGDGVGRGYLGDPVRTALAFVPDPFSGRAGARLYRTGDQVRWRPDGQLEFRGRRDFQVKLRGHRIELGDVEAALASHDAVAQAAAMIQGDGPHARLVAFVVPRAGRDLVPAELGEYAATRLPYYMVPTSIVAIDALPLTTTDKVDRARLPMLDSAADAPREGRMPEGELEHTIARVWREVLEQDAVTTTDNFFDLGGTSFRIVQVRARLSEVLGRPIELHDLFRYPTIRSLARALHDPADAAAPPDEADTSVARRAERQRDALRRARKHRGGGR